MEGLFRRRTLPHWDAEGASFFVTCCLAGSFPARGLVARHQSRPGGSHARGLETPGSRFAACDRILDFQPAVRWFSDARLAAVVQQSLLFGHGARYDLVAYVVMPSHVHWVFTPLVADDAGKAWTRSAILASFKRHTARICNGMLERSGAFWQAESYDRVIRGEGERERIITYVEHNPVRAGLCDRPSQWRFSSAYE